MCAMVSCLLQSLAILVLLIAVAIVFGGMTKSGTIGRVQKHGRLISGGVLLLFAWGVYSAVLFAGSIHLGWIWSVVMIILMLPFYFGATFVTSGELKFLDGELIIAKDSFLNKVLFDWLNFRRSRNWNLCNISWLGTVLIVVVPVLSGLIGSLLLVIGVGGLVIGILRLLFVGESPHRAFCKAILLEDDGPFDLLLNSPETIRVFEMRLYPILWIGLGFAVWGLLQIDWVRENYLWILVLPAAILVASKIILLVCDRL